MDRPTTVESMASRVSLPSRPSRVSAASATWQALTVYPEDLSRAAALARTRRIATLTLTGVALVFLSTFFMGTAPWVGYLRAAAEAGVIGGLADWFAVVALFRHPLGIPIPHTAIIPTSKDGLGRSMAGFVAQNFLDSELVLERLRTSAVARRVGLWLGDSSHAGAAAGHIGTVLRAVADASGQSLGGRIDEIVVENLAKAPTAEIVGRGLRQTVTDGAHRPLVDAAIDGLAKVLIENRAFLRRRLGAESPWWVPDTLDDAVFHQAWDIVNRILEEVRADPDHELRRMLDVRLAEVADRLVEDVDFGETFQTHLIELADRPEIRMAMTRAFEALTSSFSSDAERIATVLQTVGRRLVDDPDLRNRVDSWLEGVVGPLIGSAQREVEAVISLTVARWDAQETSRRLELWMGRDLQFVRINGTLVGALIGLTLHTLIDVAT